MCTSLDGLVKKQTKLSADELGDEVRKGVIEAHENIQKWKKCSPSDLVSRLGSISFSFFVCRFCWS